MLARLHASSCGDTTQPCGRSDSGPGLVRRFASGGTWFGVSRAHKISRMAAWSATDNGPPTQGKAIHTQQNPCNPRRNHRRVRQRRTKTRRRCPEVPAYSPSQRTACIAMVGNRVRVQYGFSADAPRSIPPAGSTPRWSPVVYWFVEGQGNRASVDRFGQRSTGDAVWGGEFVDESRPRCVVW
jgi:hypothetical protein